MLGVERHAVQREDHFRSNEIEHRNLERLHALLNSFNTQATLIVGFSLASLAADNLVALGDDQSKFCLYKPGRIFLGFFFFICTMSCIVICMACIGISFYVIVRSQQSALEVSVKLTVALVRRLAKGIMGMYLVAMFLFFLSAIATVWLFVGGMNWRFLGYANETIETGTCPANMTTGLPACDAYVANGWSVQVVQTSANRVLTTCLNPFDEDEHQLQKDLGVKISTASTLAFVFCLCGAFLAFLYVRKAFERMEMVALETQQPKYSDSAPLR